MTTVLVEVVIVLVVSQNYFPAMSLCFIDYASIIDYKCFGCFLSLIHLFHNS